MAAPWTEGDETSTVSLKILKGYKGYKSRERFWFKSIHSSFVCFVCIVISCGILELLIFIKKMDAHMAGFAGDTRALYKSVTSAVLRNSRREISDVSRSQMKVAVVGPCNFMARHHSFRMEDPATSSFFLWSTGNGIDMLWCFDLVCSIDTSAWLSFF